MQLNIINAHGSAATMRTNPAAASQFRRPEAPASDPKRDRF